MFCSALCRKMARVATGRAWICALTTSSLDVPLGKKPSVLSSLSSLDNLPSAESKQDSLADAVVSSSVHPLRTWAQVLPILSLFCVYLHRRFQLSWFPCRNRHQAIFRIVCAGLGSWLIKQIHHSWNKVRRVRSLCIVLGQGRARLAYALSAMVSCMCKQDSISKCLVARRADGASSDIEREHLECHSVKRMRIETGSTKASSQTCSSEYGGHGYDEDFVETPPCQCKIGCDLSASQNDATNWCFGFDVLRATAILLEARVSPALHDRQSVTDIFYAARPPLISVREYLMQIYGCFKCSYPCIVIGFLYIVRLQSLDPEFVITRSNVHSLTLTSMVVATKFHEDGYYRNSIYAKIGGMPCSDLNAREVKLLNALKWQLNVTEEEFDQNLDFLRKASESNGY